MDRIAIITGSDRGLGKETALALANNHYSVIMACIDIQNAGRAGDEIKSMSGNKNVFVYKIDLSSIASIKQFTQSFLQDFDHVNIVINNAGITAMNYEITGEGFEKTMAVNTIGPYMLTKLLLPYFPPGEDNRIINVSSWFYKYGRFSIEKINKYRYVKAYAVSKYAQLLISLELAGSLKERGITINAVDPGTVRTGIMRTNIWWCDFLINILLAPVYISPQEGAKTCIYAASSEELKNETGNFYSKSKRVTIPEKYDNQAMRTELLQYYETVFDKNCYPSLPSSIHPASCGA
jgi:NAD(P)-dependent dehydrogenase (short-subunit alcohol dehydrogenase family)